MPRAQGASIAGERLPREHTLRRSADYLRCYRRGRRLGGPLARLHYVRNPLEHPRLGITASRKVGNAVVRNRLKRRVRETYRRWPGRHEMPPVDVVVHLQPAAGRADGASFRREVARLFERLVDRLSEPERQRGASR